MSRAYHRYRHKFYRDSIWYRLSAQPYFKVNRQMHVILLVNGYFSAMRHTSNPTLRSDSLLHMRKLDESFQWRLGITDSGRHKLKVPHKFSRICGAKNNHAPLLGQKKKQTSVQHNADWLRGMGLLPHPLSLIGSFGYFRVRVWMSAPGKTVAVRN